MDVNEMNFILDEEFFWLTLTVVFTGLLWVPYIVKMVREDGLVPSLTSGNGTRTPDAQWAVRLKKAHANSVENLVIFASLVLMVVLSNYGSDLSIFVTMVYFFARVAHAIVFTLGLPYLRTVTFSVGFLCQAVLALILLGVL